jgi:hypothetical protein
MIKDIHSAAGREGFAKLTSPRDPDNLIMSEIARKQIPTEIAMAPSRRCEKEIVGKETP